MMFEPGRDYDVRWLTGEVTTVNSLGELARTLKENPGTQPEWSQLEGWSRHFVEQFLLNECEREPARDTIPAPPPDLSELEHEIVFAAVEWARSQQNLVRGWNSWRQYKSAELALVLAVTTYEERRAHHNLPLPGRDTLTDAIGGVLTP